MICCSLCNVTYCCMSMPYSGYYCISMADCCYAPQWQTVYNIDGSRTHNKVLHAISHDKFIATAPPARCGIWHAHCVFLRDSACPSECDNLGTSLWQAKIPCAQPPCNAHFLRWWDTPCGSVLWNTSTWNFLHRIHPSTTNLLNIKQGRVVNVYS